MTLTWLGRGRTMQPVQPVQPVRAARPSAGRGYRVTKRAVDVLVAGSGLLALLPLLALIALVVRLGSRGPALYRQTRVGLGGEPFQMLKFRSMHVGCDETVHREFVGELLAGQAAARNGLYKLDADARVTSVGRILRRTSLDELPQLVNVLRGNMSLVGPRPALPYEAELFPDWSTPRFMVRPGLTGLWQVSGRNRLTMTQGLELDVEYVSRRTFLLDLVILVRTVPAVLAGGAR